jgi:hypothetical protein
MTFSIDMVEIIAVNQLMSMELHKPYRYSVSFLDRL